ncbi:hypothetical protein AB0M80_06710 [Amycolatopsis sp. NPDC051045]|uniref:hypothetical protein n=1 Tax=Amycolatopsis sp. NPDC051045 TaxID=3156922 RepID=UPI00342C8325
MFTILSTILARRAAVASQAAAPTWPGTRAESLTGADPARRAVAVAVARREQYLAGDGPW